MTFKYIHATQVRAYERKGWACSMLSHHHGAGGYWLAVRNG